MNALELHKNRLKAAYEAMMKPESELIFQTNGVKNAYAEIMDQFGRGVKEASIYVSSETVHQSHFNLTSDELKRLASLLKILGYEVEYSYSSNKSNESMFVKIDFELLREFALYGMTYEVVQK